jgi:hypothetical protein
LQDLQDDEEKYLPYSAFAARASSTGLHYLTAAQLSIGLLDRLSS